MDRISKKLHLETLWSLDETNDNILETSKHWFRFRQAQWLTTLWSFDELLKHIFSISSMDQIFIRWLGVQGWMEVGFGCCSRTHIESKRNWREKLPTAGVFLYMIQGNMSCSSLKFFWWWPQKLNLQNIECTKRK